MIASFDYYNKFEEPLISLRSPDNDFIGFVNNIKDLIISPEFNAVSEVSCSVYKNDSDKSQLAIYDSIQNKRQFFIEGIGFFIISSVENVMGKEGIYKNVVLYSCEHELSYKKLTYFNGTYKFWDKDEPSETLLGIIMQSLPRWSVGYIDPDISSLYRTFEEPDTTIYSFLMDDVEDAYECIVEYDIKDRIINVYSKNSYVHNTTIFLSREDVINNVKVNEDGSNIYTALSLYGDEEIAYNSINPLGTPTVYNFNYYKQWMSPELQTALGKWEKNIESGEKAISSYRQDLCVLLGELQIIFSEITSINEQITLLEKQIGVNSLDGETINNLNRQIAAKKVELAASQSNYDAKASQISEINAHIDAIHTSCSFNNNFSTDELMELDAYIYEASDVEDNLAFTDDMTYSQQEEILKSLYSKAKTRLAEISVPTEELTIESSNFIFQKEFLPYTKQLNTGVIIDVALSENLIVSYIVLKFQVNYQNKSLSLTFGNKYRASNPESLWSDWQSNVSKSSTTLTYERKKYGKAVDSGSLDAMDSFMKSSLNLTHNQVKSSDGQSFELTDSGVRGRRINPSSGVADDEQIWLTANNILFTNDNWNSIKTAIGRLILPDGTTGYGVNAELLMGNWILGNNMKISNSNGSFIIDENGVKIGSYDTQIKDLEDEIANVEGGIKSITNYYLASPLSSGVTTKTEGWTTSPQTISSENKFLWNYEIITYIDSTVTTTSPIIIGAYGDKGNTGNSGKGISSITEYYALSTTTTEPATSAFSTSVKTMTATNRYLWNYEVITYTDNTQTSSEKKIIGVYGDKGLDGKDGKGVSTITNYYLASASSSGITTSTSGWTTSPQAMTTSKKYLWNYEVIDYNDSTNTITTPAIIGVYGSTGASGTDGNDGKGISSITEYYALSTTTTEPATSAFSTSVKTMTATNRYLWNYEVITYTDNTTLTTSKRIIGVYGDKGAAGTNGTDGKDAAIQSNTEPSDKSYMWLDTSVEPPLLKRYNTTSKAWESINDTSDIIDSIIRLEQSTNASIAVNTDNIFQTVSETYYAKGETDSLISEVSTDLTQTKDSFEMQFTQFNQDLNDVIKGTDAEFSEIKKYIRFEDGNIILGESGNELTLKIQNNKIAFIESGTEVAYFSNKKLYILDGEFKNSLRLGNFNFEPRQSGNLSFKKIT